MRSKHGGASSASCELVEDLMQKTIPQILHAINCRSKTTHRTSIKKAKAMMEEKEKLPAMNLQEPTTQSLTTTIIALLLCHALPCVAMLCPSFSGNRGGHRRMNTKNAGSLRRWEVMSLAA